MNAHALIKTALDTVAKGHENVVTALSNLRKTALFKRKVKAVLARQTERAGFSLKDRPYRDMRWHQAYYNANGILSAAYVPEDLFFVKFEVKLNPIARRALYRDKNMLDLLRFPCRFPPTIGRMVKGVFLDGAYNHADPEKVLAGRDEVVVKPALDTGGGRDVIFLSGAKAIDFARAHAGGDFIFQEPLLQSEELSALSSDSINTLRVMTFYDEGGARVLSSVLRMGRKGFRTDNVSSGGLSCGVKDGKLIEHAYDEFLRPIISHPDSKIVFKDYEIHGAIEAADLCARLHNLTPAMGLVSWDVSLDRDCKPVIVEINVNGQGINLHQAAHGPIFESIFSRL